MATHTFAYNTLALLRWVWIDDDLKYDDIIPQLKSWTRSVGSYDCSAIIQATRLALDLSFFTFDMGEPDSYPHAPTSVIFLLRKRGRHIWGWSFDLARHLVLLERSPAPQALIPADPRVGFPAATSPNLPTFLGGLGRWPHIRVICIRVIRSLGMPRHWHPD